MSGLGPSSGQEQQNRLKILEDLQQQKKRLQMQTGAPGATLPTQARPKEMPGAPNRGPTEARNLDQRQRQALQMARTTAEPAPGDGGEESEGGAVTDDPDLELQKARNFDCGCQSVNKVACIRQFAPEEIVRIRLDLRELTSGEKDLILLGILHTSMNTSKTIQPKGPKRKELKERTRARSTYSIHSKRVCTAAFRYIHAVSRNKLSAVQQWYREQGLTPRRKKSGGRVESKRTLKFEDTSRTVHFIRNFAEEHALAFPGRVQGAKKAADRRVLPPTFTKSGIWRNYYKPSMSAQGYRVAQLSTFRKLWQQLCPNIVFKKAAKKEKPVLLTTSQN
ncbi:uncharacterized protein LOC110989680 [Acanthaster planci]|uniref:Uncharacterized protein LOC110989680 n=1 Tax=Acanthaster planci TaxID=133434 RepID=A0A8B7ZXW0_ACAPL|nr:uncharacterized protein LOC110989680 [Acanthaster planci]